MTVYVDTLCDELVIGNTSLEILREPIPVIYRTVLEEAYRGMSDWIDLDTDVTWKA